MLPESPALSNIRAEFAQMTSHSFGGMAHLLRAKDQACVAMYIAAYSDRMECGKTFESAFAKEAGPET